MLPKMAVACILLMTRRGTLLMERGCFMTILGIFSHKMKDIIFV